MWAWTQSSIIQFRAQFPASAWPKVSYIYSPNKKHDNMVIHSAEGSQWLITRDFSGWVRLHSLPTPGGAAGSWHRTQTPRLGLPSGPGRSPWCPVGATSSFVKCKCHPILRLTQPWIEENITCGEFCKGYLHYKSKARVVDVTMRRWSSSVSVTCCSLRQVQDQAPALWLGAALWRN